MNDIPTCQKCGEKHLPEEHCKRYYFGNSDTLSCPKHVEAKKLGDKYYNQLCNISDKIGETIMALTPENVDISIKKLDGLNSKFDKINSEFMNLLRGCSKCCIPGEMYMNYAENYKKI